MIAVKSVQGRALMFPSISNEYGACSDKFPLTAFVWKTDIKEEEQLPIKHTRTLGSVLFKHSSMDKNHAEKL